MKTYDLIVGLTYYQKIKLVYIEDDDAGTTIFNGTKQELINNELDEQLFNLLGVTEIAVIEQKGDELEIYCERK